MCLHPSVIKPLKPDLLLSFFSPKRWHFQLSVGVEENNCWTVITLTQITATRKGEKTSEWTVWGKPEGVRIFCPCPAAERRGGGNEFQASRGYRGLREPQCEVTFLGRRTSDCSVQHINLDLQQSAYIFLCCDALHGTGPVGLSILKLHIFSHCRCFCNCFLYKNILLFPLCLLLLLHIKHNFFVCVMCLAIKSGLILK